MINILGKIMNLGEIVKIDLIYYLIYLITLIIHELGHAIVAKLNGMNFKIFIGNKNKKILLDTKYIRIYRTFLPSGFCQYYSKGDKSYDILSLFNKSLLILGGVLFNFVIVLILLLMINFLKMSKQYALVSDALLNANIAFIILNLIPCKFDGRYSDGLRLINYYRNRKVS